MNDPAYLFLRNMPPVLLTACTLFISSCQKEDLLPGAGATPSQPDDISASIHLNGQLIELESWSCSSGPFGAGVHVTVASFANAVEHWTLVVSTYLPDTLTFPCTWEYPSGGGHGGAALACWPDYPSTAGHREYVMNVDAPGTMTITRSDHASGGRMEGSFDLQGLEERDHDGNVLSTNNTLSGTFSIEIQ
ncbi:MAG: hypothetical protein H6592_14575 [Flavobacteriales bacterium]|nr:hypothetical protein [Flavobacteriales bacterium]